MPAWPRPNLRSGPSRGRATSARTVLRLLRGSASRGFAALSLSAAALASTPGPVAASQRASDGVRCGAWEIQASPDGTSFYNVLNDVAVLSPDDAWAVGYSLPDFSAPSALLILRWDGISWTVVPAPRAPPGSTNLQGVVASSANDVWTVGTHVRPSGFSVPFSMHWNGSAWQFLRMDHPKGGFETSAAFDVTTDPDGTLWAVGSISGQPLVERNGGDGWVTVPSEPPSGSSQLYGSTAPDSDDAWAVGSEVDRAPPLIEHWDGTTWSVFETSLPKGSFVLESVDALSDGSLLAVGWSEAGIDLTQRTFALRFDGTAWTKLSAPNPRTEGNLLKGVAGWSGGQAWAAGYQYDATTSDPLILRWSGSAWRVVPAPAVGASDLESVDALASGEAWAVGTWFDDATGTGHTLVEHTC